MELLSKDKEITAFFGISPIMAASIRLTKRCNLECVHCYADSHKGLKTDDEFSTEEVHGIIDQLAEFSVNEIFFTGGEPLLRKDIVDILKYTSSKKIRVLISTNGAAVNEAFLSKVEDVDFKLFQVSLEGPEEVHDRIRGQGSFTRAINAIRLASACLKKNVAAGTVLSDLNAKHAYKALELACEAGADVFALMLLIQSGRATEKLSATAEDIDAALKKVFDSYRRLSPAIRFAHNTTIPPALYPLDMVSAGVNTKCALCSFPYTIAIEANGAVAPCDGFFGPYNFEAGNVRKQPLKDMWMNHRVFKVVKETGAERLTGICGLCRYQEFCGGGCRAAAYICTRDITRPDPICESLYKANLFPDHALKNKASSL